MTNILNSIISNQPIYPNKQDTQNPVFTFDSDGRIKPMKDKGRLLPSRIFGSPIEYARDLKKDVVSIGKAAKGQANDHELGRINDLAMKLGSLGLAAYLFVKNPLKMSKTMEFVGFGTFFASMALWPKLAIQAPLKARTGVDIHQKYVDSQGRKKMLYQDPQYVLTDLYSKEDLNKIGKKLKVNENLPDRDRFIKQRAQKTALQGNTLWMLTAGLASPIMSALTCNVLEKPVQSALEKLEMTSTSMALQTGKYQGHIAAMRQAKQDKLFGEFLAQNAGKEMNESFVKELADRINAGMTSGALKDAMVQDLQALNSAPTVDYSFVREALKDKVNFFEFNQDEIDAIKNAIRNGNSEGIGQAVARCAKKSGKRAEIQKLANECTQILEAKKAVKPTLGQVSDKVREMYGIASEYAKGQGAVDRFVTARTGKQAGTYMANAWSGFGNELMKSLHLSMSDLKKISASDDAAMEIINKKLTELASNPKKFDKAVKRLMKQISKFENRTSQTFVGTVEAATKDVQKRASSLFGEKGFSALSAMLSDSSKTGSVGNAAKIHIEEGITGARSSLYRVLDTLSLYRQIETKDFANKIKTAMGNPNLDKTTIGRLTEIAKKVVLNATTTDYIEKLSSQGFEVSEKEFGAVMTALFGDASAAKTIEGSLGGNTDVVLKGFREYLSDFKSKVVNWQNGMTPELGRRTIQGAATNGANGAERNALVGSTTSDTIKNLAKQTLNSKKWLYMFGGAMAVLTAVTLVAGLAIGRKGDIEKQEEEKLKING